MFQQRQHITPQFFHFEQHRFIAGKYLLIALQQCIVKLSEQLLIQGLLLLNFIQQTGIAQNASAQHHRLHIGKGCTKSLIITDGKQIAVITQLVLTFPRRLDERLPVGPIVIQILLYPRMDNQFFHRKLIV